MKKAGKIVVAAYTEFALTIDREYAGLPLDELIYNHEGKPLFWRDFDPDEVPVFEFNVLFNLRRIRAKHENYTVRWFPGGRLCYPCSHLQLGCDGVPVFSHYTIDHVAEHLTNFAQYEPLTVGVVVRWFGWFLYPLENARL